MYKSFKCFINASNEYFTFVHSKINEENYQTTYYGMKIFLPPVSVLRQLLTVMLRGTASRTCRGPRKLIAACSYSVRGQALLCKDIRDCPRAWQLMARWLCIDTIQQCKSTQSIHSMNLTYWLKTILSIILFILLLFFSNERTFRYLQSFRQIN